MIHVPNQKMKPFSRLFDVGLRVEAISHENLGMAMAHLGKCLIRHMWCLC